MGHGGRTALFSDGTGTVPLIEPAAVATGTVERTYQAASAHHGVAVPLEDGAMLVSVGTHDARVGAQVVDATGTEVARAETCPGIHGEATAADAALVGCTDGVLIWADGAFTKVASPDAYGRIGNQAGSPESDVVLGDYKVDEDAELERPERVSLVDTDAKTLAAGRPRDQLLVPVPGARPGRRGTGARHGRRDPCDRPERAKVTDRIRVVQPWTEPLDWQQPRPTIHVDGQFAYVTEPASKELHVVDLATQQVIDTVTLPQVPNELTGV